MTISRRAAVWHSGTPSTPAATPVRSARVLVAARDRRRSSAWTPGITWTPGTTQSTWTDVLDGSAQYCSAHRSQVVVSSTSSSQSVLDVFVLTVTSMSVSSEICSRAAPHICRFVRLSVYSEPTATYNDDCFCPIKPGRCGTSLYT